MKEITGPTLEETVRFVQEWLAIRNPQRVSDVEYIGHLVEALLMGHTIVLYDESNADYSQ